MERTLLAALELVKISDLIFFAFGGLAVLGAAGCAFSKNVVYSAFSLLGSLIGVAALFAWLSADYLAITQLIVYVGGVLVLFLFAVMLTSKITEVGHSNPVTNAGSGFVVAAALAGFLGYVAIKTPWEAIRSPVPQETTALVGDALLTQYLLPFEILSLLILAALVGAVMMARKEIKDS